MVVFNKQELKNVNKNKNKAIKNREVKGKQEKRTENILKRQNQQTC